MSVRVLELAVLGAFAVGLLLGIVVGWQSRGQLDESRRGGDIFQARRR